MELCFGLDWTGRPSPPPHTHKIKDKRRLINTCRQPGMFREGYQIRIYGSVSFTLLVACLLRPGSGGPRCWFQDLWSLLAMQLVLPVPLLLVPLLGTKGGCHKKKSWNRLGTVVLSRFLSFPCLTSHPHSVLGRTCRWLFFSLSGSGYMVVAQIWEREIAIVWLSLHVKKKKPLYPRLQVL